MPQFLTMCSARLSRTAIGVSSTLTLSLLLGLPGFANYTPPPNAEIPRADHTGGGVRGCGGEIAALAPRLHSVGYTTSNHPTFVWYVLSDTELLLEFHLYRYQADGTLEEVLINPIGSSNPGFMAYTLPPDQADLSSGETYQWQVILYCDQNLEEVDAWSTADIQIVAPPANLTTELPDNPLQRAQTYANSGFWYEAMAEVYNATTPEEIDFRQTLLNNLVELEEPADGVDLSQKERNLIEQLRQIADTQ